MAYFTHFPRITKTLDTTDKRQAVLVDIFRRIQVTQSVFEKSSLFYKHVVKDGERPEDLATRFYGDPNYHWILLLVNNVVDPYYDWVLSINELNNFIQNKYDGYALRLVPNAIWLFWETEPDTWAPELAVLGSYDDSASEGDAQGTVLGMFDAPTTDFPDGKVMFLNAVRGGSFEGTLITQGSNTLVSSSGANIIQYQGDLTAGSTIIQTHTSQSIETTKLDAEIQHILLPEAQANLITFANADARLFHTEDPNFFLVQDDLTGTPAKRKLVDSPHHYLTRLINDEQYRITRATDIPFEDVDNEFLFTTDTVDTTNGSGPVSNLDYETELNETKRTILVLKPDFVQQFEEEFRKKLQQEFF